MSEMVERVAKAIFDRGSVLQKPWEEADDGHREFYRSLARAAIEAMREPTEAMVDVVAPSLFLPGVTTPKSERRTASSIFTGMIDAALKEG